MVLLFLELLFFFSHVSLRTGFAKGLNRPQLEEIQRLLGPLLEAAAVGYFPCDWSEDRRPQFYEGLNRAEADYAQCRRLRPANMFDDGSLFGRLATRISRLWGSQNPVLFFAATTGPVDAFARMDLDRLMVNVARAID